MAIYYPIGEALVTQDELVEKAASGQLAPLLAAARKRERAHVDFRLGRAHAHALTFAAGAPPTVGFEPIGLNKPLAIEIRHVYTGASPHRKDLLLTSAVKGMTTYEGAPRAVNLLAARVEAQSSIEAPAGTEQGTFLVFYSPAILDTSASLTIEMAYDKFPQPVFERLGEAARAAARLPLFLPYSGILVAAGMITKLAGRVGEALVDGVPTFSETQSIDIHRPGSPLPEPGFRLITSQSFTHEELSGYTYSAGKLVDKEGRPYRGRHAYVVISLDGARNDEYRDFTATAAGASLLERFYRQKEGSEIAIDTLTDAVKLLNDWKLRKKAIAVKAQIAKTEEGSPARKELQERFEGLVGGILEEDLRP